MKIEVVVASEKHLSYVTAINDAIDNAAKARGTGIARRTNEYIADKIRSGKAIIALNRAEFVGFCYIESWGHQKFVANSGLIVVPAYRGLGVAKQIKKAAFDLSRRRFPEAKLFGLTTGEQVMRINTSLGYVPVTFAKLTDDEEFWAGCKSCVNYDILQRTNMTKCLCTGMVYDPEAVARQQELARKAGKSASSGLFKHVRHVVSSMLAVRRRATSRSTMKNIANL
ncbi:GNAT family N-acetyltransferase [Butyricimonas paravirosa]|uniref:GNAT family N-acetyltransferase n=1 Tax=Butyricimonas paravirosa TaxID=1472417 RepID=UPI00351FAD8A